MPRNPEQVQQEIDAARESLAATLDELVYRSSPARLKAQGRAKVLETRVQTQAWVQEFLKTPAGQAAMAAVGLLVTVVVVQKIRHRDR